MSEEMAAKVVDLEQIRLRLAGQQGRHYWRSLEELAGTEEFQEFLHREFPSQASAWTDPAGRRRFLKIMGASLALAGVGSCTRQPDETIVPYVEMPETMVPGKPLTFATALSVGGYGTGVLVESHMGRPTKIEGNPQHPASLGATDARTQAAILGLYDPDRSQTVTHLGRIRPFGDFLGALRVAVGIQEASRGAGLAILTETVTSPTLAGQLRTILAAFPLARWHQYEPANRDHALAGGLLALGRPVEVRLRPDVADVILALDADFLTSMPGAVRYAREFARRRTGDVDMNRLYAVESTPTPTGSCADHRLPLAPSSMEPFVRALAMQLGILPADESAATVPGAAFLEVLARDLARRRGSALVIAGDTLSPACHALVHGINALLRAPGRTLEYSDTVAAEPVQQGESLASLVDTLRAGQVETLLILGGNPAYTAPADLDFAGAMARAGLCLHLGQHFDETSALCHWHVPEAHALESWSDTRAFDGTISLVQPLIAPLYGGRSAHEILATFNGQPGRPGYEILRQHWQETLGSANFELKWRRALHDGLVPETRLPAIRPTLVRGWQAALPPALLASPAGSLEIAFAPDPAIHDGRFANNGWLQELPRPLTKLTWDNAAFLAPATAQRLGVASEDVVEMELDGRKVEAVAWILPGQAADTVTAHLGYGRERGGRIATGPGFNAYALRTAAAPWSQAGLTLRPTGARRRLACTQDHHSMEDRNLVRQATEEEFRQHPDFAQHVGHEPGDDMTLYPEAHSYEGHAWGLTIDLSACTGCNACVVACQAENNIPVVGREEVTRGREMQWIRIDRYFEGDLDNPAVHHQPVTCMHCENAPCEVVCPVAATVHSSEGLNEMVYNRCVGTRYCSNNCPYKVRRFNFLLYQDWDTPSLKLQRNPDVSVRSRGVMEKCTYCVQRINGARIEARRQGQDIEDGDVVTACQQSCPSAAIVFGDLNDSNSKLSKLKASPRNYGLLTDLNTRPRTTYLAALRNPNPEMKES